MKNIAIISILTAIIALTASCGRFSLYNSDKGAIVATVGDATLFEDDMAILFTTQITREDSLAIRQMFVDRWVKDQIKKQTAEKEMDKAMPEIEKMVANYRNTLITHQFEENFVNKKIDTTITNEQIEEFYKSNIDNFRLAGPLVKARIARIPSGLRQSERLAKMFYSSKQSDVDDFLNICNKNDYKISDYSKTWVDFSEVLHHIPFSNTDFDAFLKSKPTYEVEDDQFKYLMVVESYLLTGANAPIETQSANIRKILLHNRRAELIKMLDDSLYNQAKNNNVIELY